MVRVLRKKFQWDGYSVLDAWNKIARFTNVVEPTQTLSVIVHDPPDNRILECAAEANSDYIVSADKDLLRLGTFAGVPILRSADFIQQIALPDTISNKLIARFGRNSALISGTIIKSNSDSKTAPRSALPFTPRS